MAPLSLQVAVAVLSLAAGPVAALTVNYQCVGYRPLSAEFTPREGQVHFEGHDWTVGRVRDAREARYVDARADVTIVTHQRSMTFTHGKETLECFLKSDALSPFQPASAPVK